MFQRCCPLASTIRPVAGNLIIRFISRVNGLRQCASKALESVSSKSNDLLEPVEIDDKSYALELRPNLKDKIGTRTPFKDYIDDSDIKPLHPLDVCTEDLSNIGPPLTPTFSFAKYANKSRTVQELVKLGVALYKFETKEGMVQYILNLDFERNIMPYIKFLHDCGVPADYLGEFITKNPYIFKENMDDLHTRIRYLRAHNFKPNMIQLIVCRNPSWLSYSTKIIDGRLGYFQNEFKLIGNEVRMVTVKAPKVITYTMTHLLENTFTIKEEMGLNRKQVKRLLLSVPRIWIKNRSRVLSTFEYARDEMQLQSNFIVQNPQILLCRKARLQTRHLFLMELKKAQYDPSKPMYVSPQALITGTDVDFCTNVAKTSIEIYNAFLKTF